MRPHYSGRSHGGDPRDVSTANHGNCIIRWVPALELSRIRVPKSAMLYRLISNYPRNVQPFNLWRIFRIMNERKPQSSVRSRDLRFQFEVEREADGRWIAEIPEVPGAMAYGKSEEEAKAKAYALALYAVADDVEKSNQIPDSISIHRIPA